VKARIVKINGADAWPVREQSKPSLANVERLIAEAADYHLMARWICGSHWQEWDVVSCRKVSRGDLGAYIDHAHESSL
jgi:hypothetical protein